MAAGLALAISFGPGFIALMQASLSNGMRGGLTLLAGIVLGDLLLIALGYWGFAPYLQAIGESKIGLIVGATVLLLFGTITLRKAYLQKKENGNNPVIESNKNWLKTQPVSMNILKGLALNLSNPLNFLFWVGILIISGNSYGTGSSDFFSFLAGITTLSIAADLLKCSVSHILRKKLKQKHLRHIEQISALLFLAAGVFLLTRLVS